MMLMPFTMSSASITVWTRTPAMSRRTRSDGENARALANEEIMGPPSQALGQNDRAALQVVECAPLARQHVHRRFLEPALDEPVFGARRQHEKLFEFSPPRPAFDLAQQALAGAVIAEVRVHGEAGEFAGALLRKRVERGTRHDHAIVLQNDEAVHLSFEQAAVALDQRAVRLERLDELQDAADILGARGTQHLQRVGREQRAYAAMREKLEEEGVVEMTGNEMRALYAVLARTHCSRE